MEFWGVEVKPGENVKCAPGEDKYLHLSQASLGVAKKDKAEEKVPVYVTFNGQKLVIGTLSGEKCRQIPYDLVFEKEFELSHGSKSTSVHFCGYRTEDHEADSGDESDPEHDEVLRQLAQRETGKTETKLQTQKTNAAKGDGLAAKSKAKAEEAKKADEPKADIDDDDEDDSDYSEDDSDDDSEMPDAEDDSDEEEEDDSSDEEEEITPKKAETGKKRAAADSASKTPIPEKKAKLVSPAGGQKSGDGKKGSHTATPHPAKKVGKPTANDGKPKQQQTPKSGGSVECKSCSKTFISDNALEAHSKAKHSAAK